MSLQAAFRHHEQSQEERIRGRCAWGWAWWLHPPRTVHNWEPRSRIHHCVYKRLADLISTKQQKQYSDVLGWLRCRLSFAILRSAIMCVRGSRSSLHRPRREVNIALASAKGLHSQ
jgi:hypothetical protein